MIRTVWRKTTKLNNFFGISTPADADIRLYWSYLSEVGHIWPSSVTLELTKRAMTINFFFKSFRSYQFITHRWIWAIFIRISRAIFYTEHGSPAEEHQFEFFVHVQKENCIGDVIRNSGQPGKNSLSTKSPGHVATEIIHRHQPKVYKLSWPIGLNEVHYRASHIARVR